MPPRVAVGGSHGPIIRTRSGICGLRLLRRSCNFQVISTGYNGNVILVRECVQQVCCRVLIRLCP